MTDATTARLRPWQTAPLGGGRRLHRHAHRLHQFAGADVPGRPGGGLTSAQISSWIWALSIGMAVCSIGLSLRYRTPITVAWSTPARRC
jgi:benzoate membrane transport protein